MDLYRNDLTDVLNSLPAALPLQQSYDNSPPDVVICTAGFEDRTAAVLEKLDAVGRVKGARLILIHYPTNEDANKAHQSRFDAVGSGMRSRRDIVYSRAAFADALDAELHDVPDGAHVIFDISTCSSYVFYPVMKALVSRNFDLTLTYAEANVYYPTLDEWTTVAEKADAERGRLFIHAFEDADFLSMGVDDVFPSNLFAERNPGNKPSTLVAMPNFNPIRIGSIVQRDRELNKTADDKVVWVIGVPPGEKNKWRAQALLRTNRPQAGTLAAEQLKYASTFDYKETIQVLEDIWSSCRYSSHLSIGALGSKLEHVGVFFFVYLHPEIGLWLAEPRLFKASQYSTGVGDVWAIPFGKTAELRRSLDQYMKFTWQLV